VRVLAPRAAANGYGYADVLEIVSAYERVGNSVGVDWLLAIAQMAHETGYLTSFWSARPQRNPAGLGVDGSSTASDPGVAGWVYVVVEMGGGGGGAGAGGGPRRPEPLSRSEAA
ncbi:MAG: glucosaminidase domain-containing protein, partial [Bacteroidota bacterium]